MKLQPAGTPIHLYSVRRDYPAISHCVKAAEKYFLIFKFIA